MGNKLVALKHAGRAGLVIASIAALAGCSAGAALKTGASPIPTPTTVPASVSATASPTVPPSAATGSPTATSPSPSLLIVSPIPGAPDSGVTIELVAKNTAWSLTTIKAPAGRVWHVHINDQDPTTCSCEKYNFAVSTGAAPAQRIFTSTRFGNGEYTFDIPALPAGTYVFACTIHPKTMTGVLIVG